MNCSNFVIQLLRAGTRCGAGLVCASSAIDLVARGVDARAVHGRSAGAGEEARGEKADVYARWSACRKTGASVMRRNVHRKRVHGTRR